jgi:hypothetical protein
MFDQINTKAMGVISGNTFASSENSGQSPGADERERWLQVLMPR